MVKALLKHIQITSANDCHLFALYGSPQVLLQLTSSALGVFSSMLIALDGQQQKGNSFGNASPA